MEGANNHIDAEVSHLGPVRLSAVVDTLHSRPTTATMTATRHTVEGTANIDGLDMLRH